MDESAGREEGRGEAGARAPGSDAEGPPPEEKDGSAGQDWRRLHLWQIQPVRDVLVVLLVVGLFWLAQEISIVTVPLLLAILFAYLFEPVIQWVMGRTRLARKGAVSSILIAAVLLVVVPASLALSVGVLQGAGLATRLAENVTLTYQSLRRHRELAERVDSLETRRERLERQLGREGDGAGEDGEPDTPPADEAALRRALSEVERSLETIRDPEASELAADARSARESLGEEAGAAWARLHDLILQWDESGRLDSSLGFVQEWASANAERLAGTAAATGAGVIGTTLGFLRGAFSLAFMLFITVFFFYFISTGWVEFKSFVGRLIPDRHRELTLDLTSKFDRVISAFIRGRLTIAFIQSIVFTTGYFIIGVPAAFILGPAVAILSIVPYLALIGVPVSIVLLALESHTGIRGHWLWILAAPCAIYFIGQALDDYVLTPAIQGRTTDMSTPMILFASLAGGVLFGVFGLLIAIPIAACLKIVFQEVFWPRFKAWAEGREEDFLPLGRE